MSHVTRIHTRLHDRKHLIAALTDVGNPWTEEPGTGVVRIRSERSSMALTPGPQGYTIEGILEQVDSYQEHPLLKQLRQRYAYHVACEKLEQQGFSLAHQDQTSDGRLHLVMRRMH